MKTKRSSEFVKERDIVAEVSVELLYDDNEWSPYLSPSDLQKLDRVRLALRNGDIRAAANEAKLYSPDHIAAE